MDKIWLTSYAPGVPGEVDVNAFSSLIDLFDRICVGFGDLPAFSNQGTTLTWKQLDARARDFAAYLQHAVGLRPGDRLGIMLPNLLQYPVALFGALRAGCVVVNINPQYTARELQHQLADSGAVALVVLDNFAHTFEQVQSTTAVRHLIVTRVGDMLPFPKGQIVNLVVKHLRHMVPEWHIRQAVQFPDALKQGAALAAAPVNLGPADTAFLQYTGGTTGVPKGAILSHGNMVANVEQTAAWVTGTLEEGRETAVIPLPLYHVFALTCMLAFCRIGAHARLITDPRDLPGFVRALKHEPFTLMIGVNTLFKALLAEPGFSKVKLDGVKLVVAGGMAVQRDVAEHWQRVCAAPLIEGYGLTEASPIVCANPLNLRVFSGAIGLPLPSTDVAIMDDLANEVPLGQSGEICVRGPQVMQGYWNMEAETAKTFHPGRWLRTGDIGVMDDKGFVRLIDRKKDVIVVSGFKVFPSEIEDVVGKHPGVLEAAAVRMADAHSQEAVKLVVVRRDPGLSDMALLEYCRNNLTAYKVPRQIVFRDTPLPRSPIGKVLRRTVQAEEDVRLTDTAAA
jgi:long-chain acyl-CoA synthetase